MDKDHNNNNNNNNDGNTQNANNVVIESNAEEARTSRESQAEICDIVGDESLGGRRMQAGYILEMMDAVAARVAALHARGPIVTVAVDQVEFRHPVLHLDLLKLVARLAWVGKTSMVVRVEGYRLDISSRRFQLVNRSFVTLVAVEKTNVGKVKQVPRLLYVTPLDLQLRDEVLKRQKLAKDWTLIQSRVDQLDGKLTWEDIEQKENREGKHEFLSPEETELNIRRSFLPRHLNVNATIFGGHILNWMERVAVQCARTFTKNKYMVMMAMSRIVFKVPLYSLDFIVMNSRIYFVRTYTLEVEVNVTVQRPDGSIHDSHTGHFTILNLNEAGFKREILTGLKISNSDQTNLKRYLKATERYHFWIQHDKVVFDEKSAELPKRVSAL